jgi:hypothetical protein
MCMSTSKDREQIEYLINRYKETVDNLVDLRTQIWDKHDTDEPSLLKRSLEVMSALMTIQSRLF